MCDVVDFVVILVFFIVVIVIGVFLMFVINMLICIYESEVDVFGLNMVCEFDVFVIIVFVFSEYCKIEFGFVEEFLFFDYLLGKICICMVMDWKVVYFVEVEVKVK